MKRILSLVAAVGMLLVATATPAAATDPGSWSTCSGKSYITLAEDAGGGGDRVILCRPSTSPVGKIVNLSSVSHAQTGYCNAPFNASDTWNDCVSSVYGRFSTPDSTLLTNEFCVVIYDGANATGDILGNTTSTDWSRSYYFYNLTWRNMSTGLGGDNDRASSIRWGRVDGTSARKCLFS